MATEQNRPNDRPNDKQGTEQNSYNKMGMFTFVASMVASLGVLIYVSFLSGGIDLKEIPDQKPGQQTEQKTEKTTEQKVPGTNAPTDPTAPAAQPAAKTN